MGKDLSNANTNEKELEKFIIYLSKLEFVQLSGLCNLLGVPIYDRDENDVPTNIREYGDIIEDCIDNFSFSNRKDRKEIMKLLKQEFKNKKG